MNDNGWLDQVAEKHDEADAAYTPGMTIGDLPAGKPNDMNLHLHDLLVGPNPNVPDIMAGWTSDGEES